MPTMDEVLAAVPSGKRIFIELKSGAEIVAPMEKIIAASLLSPEQIAIISFHEEAVAECKKRLPHVKAFWLCGFKKDKNRKRPLSADEVIETLQRCGADGLDAEAVPEHVDAAFIERIRKAGFDEFHVWTVDDPEVARFYQRLGVRSITDSASSCRARRVDGSPGFPRKVPPLPVWRPGRSGSITAVRRTPSLVRHRRADR